MEAFGLRLNDLIDDLPIEHRFGPADAALTDLTDDSRAVTPGSFFIARPGGDGDALRFVPDAIKAGAIALLLPALDDDAVDALSLPDGLAVVVAQPNTAVDQRLCGTLAERFFGEPSRKLKLIGVTGTNGKTTTVTITQHLINHAGHTCGLIGTVSLDTGDAAGPRPATLTTPGAIELSRLLAEMVDNGCAYCAMEVSSHALDQGRVAHLRFAAAAFTNLTQDHLDYHGTMEAYADAKAVLFEGLDQDAVAVINIDDPSSKRMSSNCKATIKRTTTLEHQPAPGRLQIPAEYAAIPMELTSAQSKVLLASGKSAIQTYISIPGRHNLDNAIIAAGIVSEVTGLTLGEQQQAIESCGPVPGRLEPVPPDWPPNEQEALKQGAAHPHPHPTVVVDYAHTPDALINVGRAVRELTKGKLITVFGCGGDRDRAKRPLMAKAAQDYAHTVVLTSDNPRTENPEQILDDAAAGFKTRLDTHVIPDRAEAIRFAIQLAAPNDTVLIAGKGHEDYQILGTEKVHFDDREHAAAALREKIADA